ncbi:MAG: CotH kinase family protein [Saprospiraceae bacterium]|nr:CotH kinase family protein [Saprospiraceae bacterium]
MNNLWKPFIRLLLGSMILNGSFAQIRLSEFCPDNQTLLPDASFKYEDWIEIYNSSSNFLTIKNLFLTDNPDKPNKWAIPAISMPPQSFHLFFASGKDGIVSSQWHTNFSLSKDGEFLGLWSNEKGWIDSLQFGPIPVDHTYVSDMMGQWFCSGQATPLEKNESNEESQSCEVQNPKFSLPSGFYHQPIEVELNSTQAGIKIYYTTDGTDPTDQSLIYHSPILVNQSMTVKAIAYNHTRLSSDIVHSSFHMDTATYRMPLLYLSVDSKLLFDSTTGIFMSGPNASSEYPYYGANFWSEKEIPAHISYFSNLGEIIFEGRFDIAVHGGKSTRTQAMKPMRIYAKEKYRQALINFPFFPSLPESDLFKRIVLRNSGSDFNKAHLRDGYLCHYINSQKLNVIANGYQPVIVYINGEFYGLMEVREKLDSYYPLAKYKLLPEQIDFLEDDSLIITGDRMAFDSLYHYIVTHDLSKKENYEFTEKFLDIPGFCDYLIAETYFNNWDWPNNNVKYWRKKDQGKWNYLFYDSDVCLNAFPWAAHTESNLGRILGPVADHNKHISIFKALLKNDSFKNYFINRYADLINTSFRPSKMMAVLDSLELFLESAMHAHFNKWGSNVGEWKNELNTKLRTYITFRPEFAFEHIRKEMKQDSLCTITVETLPKDAGVIQLNSLTLNDFPFSGQYFTSNSVQLNATRKPGYRFAYWLIGKDTSFSSPLNIFPINEMKIQAVYQLAHNEDTYSVYPNPANHTIYLEYYSDSDQQEQISFSDISGKIYSSHPIKTNQGVNYKELNVEALSNGIYFLQLSRRNPKKLLIIR